MSLGKPKEKILRKSKAKGWSSFGRLDSRVGKQLENTLVE